MKEERLILAIKNIDDDLICEAQKRRRNHFEAPEEYVAEPILAMPLKRKFLWRYPISVAAVLAVFVGAVIAPRFLRNLSVNNSEASGAKYDDAPLSSKIVISLADDRERVVVSASPKIPELTAEGSGSFRAMSTKEALAYYGLDHINKHIESGFLTEVFGESPTCGIYTSFDGTVYDVNTFYFKVNTYNAPEVGDALDEPIEFKLTVSKKTPIAEEHYAYIDSFGYLIDNNGTLAAKKSIAFYSKADDMFFTLTHTNLGASVIYSLTPKDSILRGKAQNLSEDIWHWNAEYDRNDGETAEAFKNRIISHNKAYNEQIQALNEQRLSEYEKIKRIYAEHFKTCKDHAALEETCDKALLAAFKENGLDYNKDGSLAEDGIGKNILASIFELTANYASINGCEKCTKDYR